jgi:hypothetical protein
MLGPASLALGLVVACGSSAQGVAACKSIEEARCRQIPNCPDVTVSPPIWYTSGSAVDACVRYYDVACEHGLSIGSNPSTSQVNDCVDLINSDCTAVADPTSTTNPACSWLVPPAEVDAGDGGDATDGDASDASDGSDSAGE